MGLLRLGWVFGVILVFSVCGKDKSKTEKSEETRIFRSFGLLYSFLYFGSSCSFLSFGSFKSFRYFGSVGSVGSLMSLGSF